MMPLISIITTAYKSDDTIFSAIDSVLLQGYPNIQYIISDDCSPNFDVQKISDYIKQNNRGNITSVIITQTKINGGICKNLNHALSFVEGEYIFNLSADDAFYDENVISEWVDRFETSEAKIITALRALYDKQLTKILYVAPSKSERRIIQNSTSTSLFNAMIGHNIVFGCCTALTRACLEDIGGYDERYPNIEDYPLFMKLLRRGTKICFWDRIVIKYRDGGISSCENLDDDYFLESDTIFENEILPFADNKQYANKLYEQWKVDTLYHVDKFKMAIKFKKNRSVFSKLIYRIAVICKHPIHAFRELILKLGR